MMSADVAINGFPIGKLYLHNEGPQSFEDGDCTYHVEYYEVGKGKLTLGKVVHKRSDGAVKLLHLAFGLLYAKGAR